MHSIRTVAGAFLAATLAGCATTEPAAVLAGGPRMIDLYRGAASEPWPPERSAAGTAVRQAEPSPEARSAPEAPQAPEGAVVEATCRWWGLRWPCEAPAPPPAPACACSDAPRYTRTAANELELLFPRLPNPDVFIYVPAHLATELRIPVPGYTTAVPLYDRVEYALPGEGAAARGPSESPPGASPEETGSGASTEEAPPGPSPEEARPDVSLEVVRPDANPEEAPAGASTEETQPGGSPVKVPPGVSQVEARPHAGMEAAP